MKNQFFADRRDYFKYDLLLEILDGTPSLDQLTILPMLTPDDEGRHGTLTDYCVGSGRPDLYHFLKNRRRRDIREMQTYLGNQRFAYTCFRDSSHFSHDEREEYFRNIPDGALRSALVFLDPDNGLKVKSMSRANGDKYLRYEELAAVFQRMDAASVAVVYQHLPRRKREPFFGEIGQNLRDSLSVTDVTCVSDNEIGFFVVARSIGLSRAIRRLLEDYAKQRGHLFSTCTTTGRDLAG
jgi:hypothetical protein